MASPRKTQVVITANAATAKKVMDELQVKIDGIKAKMAALDVTTKQGAAEFKKLEKELVSYNSAVAQNITNTERIKNAVNNLSGTSLKELRRALASAKTEMGKFSENTNPQRVQQLREQMRALQNQIKLLEGEYVNVRKHIGNLDTVSTQWLNKAIAQQQQVLAKTKEGTMEYARQKAMLDQLQAAQARRAIATVTTNKTASASQLQAARQALVSRRDSMASNDEKGIAQMNQAIAAADERLSKINGKIKETGISWKQMRQVLASPDNATGEDIKKTMDVIQQKIAKLPAGSQRVADLRKQYQLLDQTLKGTKKDVVDVNNVLLRAKACRASIDELKRAYKQLEEELQHIKVSDAGFKQKQQQMQTLKKHIDSATGAVQKHGGAWRTALQNITAYFGLMQLFSKLQSMITGVISANFKLSDQLADIRKVSGLASQEIEDMSRNLAKLDTRTTIQELNRIAYAGAKLGIGNYGVEGLESFVRASNQVNVALKEDLGDEALTALSKITQVMGLIPQMGVEQAMLKTGSAIFKLASTSTATSGKIIDFSNRMLSLGKNAALSTADILALGAAVDSMALEPEVAATAFGKLVTEIRKGTGSIEKDLGLAAGSLKKMVETGNGMDAILTIFKAMHDQGNVFALNGLFKDMGSDGARLVKTMVTMADKVDMLSDAVGTANEAFIQGAAITNEYKIQQQTAQGILERANNMWQKAFVNPEGVNAVKEVAQTWYDFTRSMTQSSEARNSIMTTFKILVESCKLLISLLPTITGFLIGKGFAIAAQGIWGVVTAIRAWIVANEALNISFGNVVGIVAGAAGLLYSFFSEWSQRQEDATQSNYKFTKSLSEAYKEVGKARTELDNYKRAITSANEGTKERTAAINNFNNKFGSYLSNLLTEKSTAEDIAKAYDEAANAIKRKVMAQMKERDIEKYVAPKAGREAQLLYDYDKEAKRLGIGFNGSNLQGFVDDQLKAGKNTQQMINEIIRRSGIGSTYGAQYRNALISSVATTNGAPADSFNWTYISKRDGRGDLKMSENSKYTDKEKLTAWAVAYIRQRMAKESAMNDVQDKFRFYPDLQITEAVSGVPVGDGGDGDKKGGTTNPKTNNEMNMAKSGANALLANIQAYYEEQARKFYEWVAEMNKNGEKVSEGYIKEFRNNLTESRLNAEGLARQSIATAGKEWDAFKGQLTKDQFQTATETDKRLLAAIEQSDVKELHDLFEKLGANLSKESNKTLSENLGALLDEIFKNGAKNLSEAAERIVKRQQEIQKILNEHDYTGTVDRNTRSKFDELRFLRPAQGVNKDTVEGQEKMAHAFNRLTKKARESVMELYKIDPASEEFQQKMLDFLAVADEGFDFTMYKQEEHAEELKALYIELIKYTDSYTEALKKYRNEKNKNFNDEWAHSAKGMNFDADIENLDRFIALQKSFGGQMSMQDDGTGVRTRSFGKGMAQDMGFASNEDPETAMLRLKYEKQKDIYTRFAEMYQNDANMQKEVEDKKKELFRAGLEYATSVAAQQQKQVNNLTSFLSPIQQFGWAAGEAFAAMVHDSKEGQNQMKAALKSMVTSFAQSTLDITKQNLIYQMNTALTYSNVEANAAAHSSAMEAIETTKGTTLNAIHTTASMTYLGTELGVTVSDVALSQARAIAKCFATLGPIGGAIAVSAVMAAISAALSFAINSMFGGDDKSNASNAAKGPNTKLVSGMLTYDSGNVRDLKPFFDKDGNMYWAEDNSDTANQGINLLTHPTATNINGQPSLVAEQGPELVIGRETTKAIMQDNPTLLKALYQYDKHHSGRTAYDQGNLSEFGTTAVPVASASGIDSDTRAMIAGIAQMLPVLMARLNKPISAKIDMYGRGNLYDSMQKANMFMKNK